MQKQVPKYPTQVCGPASCEAPINSAVVRIVLGDARRGTPVLQWRAASVFNKHQHLWLNCFSPAREGEEPQQLCQSVAKNVDVPNVLLNFSARGLDEFELSFSVYCTSTADSTSEKLFEAHGGVLGIELTNLSGVLTRPLIDGEGRVVGILTFEFLVIKPFLIPQESFLKEEEIATGRGSGKKSLDKLSYFTGHRGMGKTSAKRLKENTVVSFLEATRSQHVSHIELDVQLTKDGAPVIYHDWFFRTHGRDKDADASSLPVPIYNLTLKELHRLYSSGIRTEEHIKPSPKLLEECLAPITTNADVQGFLTKDKIRTLAEVCMCLPKDVGVMVEIKYPSPNVQRESHINYPQRNEIVDRVLHDLFCVESNSERSILFLSFDPDICLMLALKQNRYPVFFSNCDGRDEPCEDLDPRCISFAQGIEFAASQCFDGILFYEDILFKNPESLAESKKKGLTVLSYGARNSDPSWAAQQIDSGVDSVIADDVHDVVEGTIPKCRNDRVKERSNWEPREFVGDSENLVMFDREKQYPFRGFPL